MEPVNLQISNLSGDFIANFLFSCFQAEVHEWLHLLNLDNYLDTLHSQGYDTVDGLTDITWEDLEEIGIKKLGQIYIVSETSMRTRSGLV